MAANDSMETKLKIPKRLWWTVGKKVEDEETSSDESCHASIIRPRSNLAELRAEDIVKVAKTDSISVSVPLLRKILPEDASNITFEHHTKTGSTNVIETHRCHKSRVLESICTPRSNEAIRKAKPRLRTSVREREKRRAREKFKSMNAEEREVHRGKRKAQRLHRKLRAHCNSAPGKLLNVKGTVNSYSPFIDLDSIRGHYEVKTLEETYKVRHHIHTFVPDTAKENSTCNYIIVLPDGRKSSAGVRGSLSSTS